MRLIKNNGKRAHIQHSGRYYIVSDNGRETLIFPSDITGEITDMREVGGASGATLTEVLGNFDNFLHIF